MTENVLELGTVKSLRIRNPDGFQYAGKWTRHIIPKWEADLKKYAPK